jgi:hypothetical protein
MATNFVRRILIADAANATQLTAPNRGSNISTITGWTAIGATAKGDDGNLDSDAVEYSCFDEVGVVQSPISLVPEDVVPFQNGIESFGFTCYDASEAVIELASDVTVTSNVAQKTLATVKRSVIVEVNGLFFDYFPNVELSITAMPNGLTDVSKLTFMARVCAGTVLASGWNREYYQAA